MKKFIIVVCLFVGCSVSSPEYISHNTQDPTEQRKHTDDESSMAVLAAFLVIFVAVVVMSSN